jgi:hypothetical protein
MLDLSAAFEIASLDRPELKDDPWLPITQARLKQPQADSDLFSEIRRSDILVHHPYESFTTSYEAFIRTAAADPAVTALKTTVYRTSDESPIVPSSSPLPSTADRLPPAELRAPASTRAQHRVGTPARAGGRPRRTASPT